MDFTELPRLLGWADFQPAYIFGLMQKIAEPPPLKNKINFLEKTFLSRNRTGFCQKLAVLTLHHKFL